MGLRAGTDGSARRRHRRPAERRRRRGGAAGYTLSRGVRARRTARGRPRPAGDAGNCCPRRFSIVPATARRRRGSVARDRGLRTPYRRVHGGRRPREPRRGDRVRPPAVGPGRPRAGEVRFAARDRGGSCNRRPCPPAPAGHRAWPRPAGTAPPRWSWRRDVPRRLLGHRGHGAAAECRRGPRSASRRSTSERALTIPPSPWSRTGPAAIVAFRPPAPRPRRVAIASRSPSRLPVRRFGRRSPCRPLVQGRRGGHRSRGPLRLAPAPLPEGELRPRPRAADGRSSTRARSPRLARRRGRRRGRVAAPATRRRSSSGDRVHLRAPRWERASAPSASSGARRRVASATPDVAASPRAPSSR